MSDIYDDEGNKLTSFKSLYDYKRKLEAKAEAEDNAAYRDDASQAEFERKAKAFETSARDHRYDRDDARKKVAEITTLLDNWKDA